MIRTDATIFPQVEPFFIVTYRSGSVEPIIYEERGLRLRYLEFSASSSAIAQSEIIRRMGAIRPLIEYIDDENKDELITIFMKNIYIPLLLGEAIQFINGSFGKRAEEYRVGISLGREDPERPKWFLVNLIACGRWKFKDFNERFEAILKTEDYIEARTRELMRADPNEGGKVREANFVITVFIGEVGEDCEVFRAR